MSGYFSEKTISKEMYSPLRKNYPRAMIDYNYMLIPREGEVDYNLLLNFFDCAVAKHHNLYEAGITLPSDLEMRIPSWYVQSGGELWVDPESGPRGLNALSEEVFTVKFHLYVDERDIHKIPESKNMSVEEALLAEFFEIKHALIQGNEEPIDIFKSFYGGYGEFGVPKTKVAQYLASILSNPK